MGLFDKKKNSQPEAEDVNTKEQAAASQATGAEAQRKAGGHGTADGRRFVMAIEGISPMLDGEGVVVSGSVSGTVKKGDEIYIIQYAGKPNLTATVVALESNIDGKMTIADESTDTVTNLQLDLSDASQIVRFAVVSSIRPQEKLNIRDAVENPALAGLINILPKYAKDKNYNSCLSYLMAHAYFITPIKVEGEVDEADGKITLKKDTQIGFFMMKTTAKLDPAKGDDEQFVLPVFTDWEQLKKWKGLSAEGERVQTQIIRIRDLAAITNNDKYSGFVVNPLNKVPFTANKIYAQSIINSEGFKKEFGEPQAQPSAEEASSQKKFILGVPKETDEVNKIREILADYGKNHDDINEIYLMAKVDENKQVRYLIMLDTSIKELKPTFDEIYQAILPECHDTKAIEFNITGRIPAVDQIAENNKEKMLIYSK